MDEAVAAGDAAHEAFETPPERRSSHDALAAQFEALRKSRSGAVYGAWLDGELVGSARAFFSPRGVLLAGGSTLPAARGRGVYRALVRARWDDAVEAGLPALVVHAGAMSRPILERLGFEQVLQFRRVESLRSG